MTSPDNSPAEPGAAAAQYAARSYRSMPGVVSGVLLLALAAWLVGDAVVRGEGRTPWLALAGLLMIAPMVIAFTLRPVVLAGDERMIVRNPFRTITLPWASVVAVRAGYSTEVLAGASKYQMWAIPVSLRQRKRATRRQARNAVEDPFSRTRMTVNTHVQARGGGSSGPTRPWPDAAVNELRELAERNKEKEGAAGEISVRWAFEVIAPALAGALVLAVLLATG